MRSIAAYLDAPIDEEAFARDLLDHDEQHGPADLPAYMIQ